MYDYGFSLDEIYESGIENLAGLHEFDVVSVDAVCPSCRSLYGLGVCISDLAGKAQLGIGC